MVRSYQELNELEKIGLKSLLKDKDWDFCRLGDKPAFTKKMSGKYITVLLDNFNVDED